MNGTEWIAYAFIMPGLLLAGKWNNPFGWLLQFTGCLIFSVLGFHFEIYGITFANLVFATIGMTNYLEQRKK